MGITMSIGSARISDPGNDYDSRVIVDGTLVMNLPAGTAWTLQGRMDLISGTVRGRADAGDGTDLKVSGLVRVTGAGTTSTLDCWVDFQSDADVYVYSGVRLDVLYSWLSVVSTSVPVGNRWRSPRTTLPSDPSTSNSSSVDREISTDRSSS